jgi:hypothetical protein
MPGVSKCLTRAASFTPPPPPLVSRSDATAITTCNDARNHLDAKAGAELKALETVGQRVEFVAPEDGSYVAVLLTNNANAVDVPWRFGFHQQFTRVPASLNFECWDSGRVSAARHSP